MGLQVGHGVCVDAVNGHHKVALAELGLGSLAAGRDLRVADWERRHIRRVDPSMG